MICMITAFIPSPDHSFCLEKMYLESYFLEYLVDDVGFQYHFMNTYVIGISSFILSTLGGKKKQEFCFLLMDSFGMLK